MLPILLALALQLQTYTPLSAVPNCAAFAPVSGGGYDAAWTEYTLTDAGIAALMVLDTSSSFWVGYDHGGFNVEFLEADPALTRSRARRIVAFLILWWFSGLVHIREFIVERTRVIAP